MTDIYAHLPGDIAKEKHIAIYLRREYKRAIFGGIRNFRALRSQAPGVIVEFVLAAALTISVLLLMFHDLNASGHG